MPITRELAIKILRYCHKNPDFYFPFLVMCQERTPGDGNLVGIDPEERKIIEKDNTYQIFELQENLQNIYLETMELLSQ
ncbi:MAG: hypothetical protein LBI53_07970 [Candidatus Peribacteria bacterium]|jgi:hypothetical protein|nr:hypothetical protein [Candidatus Peribacteria bacterium]